MSISRLGLSSSLPPPPPRHSLFPTLERDAWSTVNGQGKQQMSSPPPPLLVVVGIFGLGLCRFYRGCVFSLSLAILRSGVLQREVAFVHVTQFYRLTTARPVEGQFI